MASGRVPYTSITEAATGVTAPSIDASRRGDR